MRGGEGRGRAGRQGRRGLEARATGEGRGDQGAGEDGGGDSQNKQGEAEALSTTQALAVRPEGGAGSQIVGRGLEGVDHLGEAVAEGLGHRLIRAVEVALGGGLRAVHRLGGGHEVEPVDADQEEGLEHLAGHAAGRGEESLTGRSIRGERGRGDVMTPGGEDDEAVEVGGIEAAEVGLGIKNSADDAGAGGLVPPGEKEGQSPDAAFVGFAPVHDRHGTNDGRRRATAKPPRVRGPPAAPGAGVKMIVAEMSAETKSMGMRGAKPGS